MDKKTMRNLAEWVLPWIIGVGLIWVLTGSAEGAVNDNVDDRYDPSLEPGSGEPVDLYDMGTIPRKIRKVVFRASVYGKRGDHGKAVDVLTEHLRDHPDQDHPLLRMHLAQNLADLGDVALAKEEYRKAVMLEPKLDRAWFGLADAAYELEDYALAGEAFARGYWTSPERPVETYYFAGASYLMADMPAEAFAIFDELVAGKLGSPQLPWYQGLVVAAARMEQPERADRGVAQMTRTFADDPEAWYLRYQHEAGKKEFRQAAIALNMVGLLRDLTEAEKKQLGDIYLVLGVPWLASREYRDAMADEATVEEVERLGSALVAAHETDLAVDLLAEAVVRHDTARLWSLLGDVHYLRQEYGPAKEAFARIAAQDETGRAWLMQGYCALELGDKEAALDLLARATTYPDLADMAQILLQRAQRM
jgi:tetratricopeptide (TPR) repeat protein